MRLFPVVAVLAAIGVTAVGARDTTPAVRAVPIQAADCDQIAVQLDALSALINMDAERAMPILRKVLARRDECAETLRRKAVFLVAQHRAPDTEDLLLGAAQVDPDPEVREQAVFWLSQVGTERAVAGLDSILMQSSDRRLQEKAIFALSQHGAASSAEILRRYAAHADNPLSLRENSVFWIGQEGGEETEAFLRELYESASERQLKEKIIFSVSQRESLAGTEWLLGIAQRDSEPRALREKALFWASQERGVEVRDLVELYGAMEDRELREKILFGLSQRHESAAVDALVNVARNETDVALRKKAIFWLGQSPDPRAAEFLMELIGNE